MIKKFESFNINDDISDNIFTRNHTQWINQYPELKLFKLQTDYYNGKLIWFYGFDKSYNDINFDIFIEIRKGSSWELNFELTQTTSTESNFVSEEEKHYHKTGLDTTRFQTELSGLCKYIQNWNDISYKQLGIHPLIDSE